MTLPRPPRLARLLLRVLPLGDLRQEIEADLAELFEARLRTRGVRHASRRYSLDVISLWRGPRVHSRRVDATHLRERASALSAVAQDLGHAVRLFRRSPAAVSVVVVGLGIAIGAGTSLFALLQPMILRPVGIVDPATAVRVLRGVDDGLSTSWPYPEFERVRAVSTHVDLAATLRETVSVSARASTESAESAYPMFVSGNYFSVMNNRMTLGRALARDDDVGRAPPVLVLSYPFWQRRFGADPSIVGRDLFLNGTPFTVVGVAARGFTGTTDTPPSLWAPLASYDEAMGGPTVAGRASVRVHVVGRLESSVTTPQAEAALTALAMAVGAEFPNAEGQRLKSVKFTAADRTLNRRESAVMALVFSIAMVVILLILLLACINVAQLLLASATARQREIGVRLALGASRRRLIRQLLTESTALGIAGGAIGLVLTIWLVPILVRVLDAPAGIDFSPDPVVYLFLVSVSLIAGVVAGLAPARHCLRDDLTSSLKELGGRPDGTTRPARIRGKLIGLQAGVSLLLLVLAALLTRSMVRASAVDIGFDANRLLTISLAFGRGTNDAAAADAYWSRAVERAVALPDVTAASLSDQSPFQGANVTVFNRGRTRYTIYHNQTEADYFATLGLRVLRGRSYTRDEVLARAPVAVISETLARDFFAGEDPVGQRLDRVIEKSPRIIIGVVANAITARLRELGSAAIYSPIDSMMNASMLVRTNRPPEQIIQSMRTALLALDSRAQLDIRPLSNAVNEQLAQPRQLASLAGVLAGLALILAVIGIYGVTAFVVGQRRKEVSVRIAVGASAADVMRLLVRDSLRPVFVGLAGGLLAALLASRVLTGVLFGLSSLDPLAFGAAIAVLLTAATGAVVLPTRHAASVEPASLLREL